MKKKIAIMLTLILAAGAFTACTAEEKVNNDIKTSVVVQFAGKEVTEKDLIAAVKKAYTKKGNKVGDIKTIEIYVKPEESAAYYVVNGDGADDYKIEL